MNAKSKLKPICQFGENTTNQCANISATKNGETVGCATTMTSFERIMNHFNATVPGCKRRRESKPQIAYLPGCAYIECEHADCRCRMNEGEGLPLSEFIVKWEARHGQ